MADIQTQHYTIITSSKSRRAIQLLTIEHENSEPQHSIYISSDDADANDAEKLLLSLGAKPITTDHGIVLSTFYKINQSKGYASVLFRAAAYVDKENGTP